MPSAFALKKQGLRFHWWYESVIDWMLSNPDKAIRHAAASFDVSENWLYTVVSSDAFQERLAERRREISDAIKEEVLDRAGRVASKGLRELEKRLDNQETSKIPLRSLSEVTETALKALGYGAGSGASIVVNNQNNVAVVETAASAETIHAVRQQMREGHAAVQSQLPIYPGPELDLTAEPSLDGQLDLPIEPTQPPAPQTSPSLPEELIELAFDLDAA